MRINSIHLRLFIGCAVVAFCLRSANAQFGGGGNPRQWELWKINVDGSGLARIVDVPGMSCSSPAWSPDGKQIACSMWPIKQIYCTGQIAVFPADGSKPPRPLGLGGMGSWSPDGSQIVGVAYGLNGETAGVFVANADGTGKEMILEGARHPRWSPRGNRIAVVDGNTISILDLATGQEHDILRKGYRTRMLIAISPDGLRYCFGNDDRSVAIATIDEKSMETTIRKVANAGAIYGCSWSPDGKRVVFSSALPGEKQQQLYMLKVDSNDKPIRLPGQDPTRDNECPDWSPDGKTIAFSCDFPVPVSADSEAKSAALQPDKK